MLLPALCVLFFAQNLHNFINCGSECQARAGSDLGAGLCGYLCQCGSECEEVFRWKQGRNLSSSGAMSLSCVLYN